MFQRRRLIVASIGMVMFLAGTMVGRGQQSRPDFVIEVTADPAGTLTARCLSGCQFQSSRQISPERFSTTLSDTISTACPTGCKTMFNGVVVRRERGTN